MGSCDALKGDLRDLAAACGGLAAPYRVLWRFKGDLRRLTGDLRRLTGVLQRLMGPYLYERVHTQLLKWRTFINTPNC